MHGILASKGFLGCYYLLYIPNTIIDSCSLVKILLKMAIYCIFKIRNHLIGGIHQLFVMPYKHQIKHNFGNKR